MAQKNNQSVSVVSGSINLKQTKKGQGKISLYCSSGLCDATPALSKLYLSQSTGKRQGEADLYGRQAGNEAKKNI